MFPEDQLRRLKNDAPRYRTKIIKDDCSEIYTEIYSACKLRLKLKKDLVHFFKAYEDEQACKAASYHETGPDRKKIRRGFAPVLVDELTEWHTMLSAKRNERQVPPTLAPFHALKRYSQISSHPLNMTSRPGILSMDIHPSKDIVATGGIDTNAVLFDWPSSQIVCMLTGYSKKITSLKFVNRNGLFITGSADKTVRIWQPSEDENYSCIHTLKDHTAEVEAVTVHASQKYFVTTSRDSSWRFYDISTGSCLAEVSEASVQEGDTSAAFHPDGLILGTGTTDGAVKIWDVKSQTRVINIRQHVGPVNAISFSENGCLLATAGSDGFKIWDGFTEIVVYLCVATVEFDFSGSYLAFGGSDACVCEVRDFDRVPVIKRLTDPSVTEKVTSMKFGADARYIAASSMEGNLRIFGPTKIPDVTKD